MKAADKFIKSAAACLCAALLLTGCAGAEHPPRNQMPTDPSAGTEGSAEESTLPTLQTEPAPSSEPELQTDPAPVPTEVPQPTENTQPSETVQPDSVPIQPPETEPAEVPEPSVPPTEKPRPSEKPSDPDGIFRDPSDMGGADTEEESDSLEEILKPGQITILKPEASGILTREQNGGLIDYSNTRDGYVMVRFTHSTEKKLKVQVIGPTTKYTYNLTPLEWTVFPLSDGNGAYSIKVFENIAGNRYAMKNAVRCDVTMTDPFAPFIRPNQYVNYEHAEKTIRKAAELTAGVTDLLGKVERIYDYVVDNITYDYEKAEEVESGYLPDLDEVLTEGEGICFDYASLMTGMLRSQGVPCKLIVGYAGPLYHAWISVWSETSGWVDGVVFFDGTTWKRMDPTFASSGNRAPDIMEYINNGKNYTTKYIY